MIIQLNTQILALVLACHKLSLAMPSFSSIYWRSVLSQHSQLGETFQAITKWIHLFHSLRTSMANNLERSEHGLETNLLSKPTHFLGGWSHLIPWLLPRFSLRKLYINYAYTFYKQRHKPVAIRGGWSLPHKASPWPADRPGTTCPDSPLLKRQPWNGSDPAAVTTWFVNPVGRPSYLRFIYSHLIVISSCICQKP